jgi:hypothetical protein
VAREALCEETVRAHSMEDGLDLRRRELGAARLRQPLGDQCLEQPRLQPGVVEMNEEASSSGHRLCGLGGWIGAAGAALTDDGGGGKGVVGFNGAGESQSSNNQKHKGRGMKSQEPIWIESIFGVL